jgi:hypothetical protein
VNLIYFIIFVYRKPLSVDPSKKIVQPAPSSYATPITPYAGVISSTALSAAKALDFCRRTVEFLEGLKNRDTDQQGNPFTPSLFLPISLADLRPSLFAVLANNLKAVQKALSNEKSVRLGAENSLAEGKTTRQAAEQSLQQFKDVSATLALKLENAQTSLAATHDKLDSKSKALDFQVIRADEAILRLKNAESRLKATEEYLNNQRQLLKSAQKTSSMRKNSFNMIISSAVAHAATLFKNHLPGLNMELLHQDLTVDDAELETLVSSAFDAAQDFVSLYDSANLAESDDNDSPKTL